ncbi:MAG: rhomboid family intramembrane serine protease [Gemmatimonadaceae bacterium]|nr:rhomboid family intramembrane serine protease [Gemmatimonadaceae bacterium]
MIPIGDDNPTIRVPVVTIFLIVAMFAVWVLVQGAGADEGLLAASVCNLGMVPGELTGLAPLGSGVPIGRDLACVIDNQRINLLTPVLSMFLHGGWMHIIGNAMFLWVFGNNIEDVVGRRRFLAFYLICGLAAAAAHVAVDPRSPVPTVGASGAVSGVMGAYLVLFPKVRVRMLFFFVIILKVIPLPAWLVLLYWFGLQLLSGIPELLSPNPEIAGGVAVWAHVGGFVAGVLLVRAFVSPKLLQRRHDILLSRNEFDALA